MADVSLGALAGASLFGSLIQGRAAGQAASAQEAATQAGVEEQRRQFDISRGDIAPWRTAGVNALGRLEFLLGTGQTPDVQTAQAAVQEAQAQVNQLSQAAQPSGVPAQFTEAQIRSILGPRPQASGDSADPAGLAKWKRDAEALRKSLQGGPGGAADSSALQTAQARLDQARNALVQAQGAPQGQDYGSLLRNFTEADFQTAPGYEFRLGEGQKAIERSAAARGNQLSGATLKGLTRYGQDFASNEFQNAYNRDLTNRQNIYNMLAGVSGTGQVAGANMANIAQATGQGVADLYTQGGNARAAGIMGRGNALTGGISDVAQYYALRNLLK